MAVGQNVGAIYYEVEADTSKLVNSSTDLDVSLDRLNKRFAQTDKAANDVSFKMTKTAQAVKGLGRESSFAANQLSGLAKLIGGLLTLQGVRGLIEMAEAYNEMAERVQMATSSTAEYELVQARLLNTANKTYRALSEAQEVYILTADSVRSLGYSTEGVLDITDSLSYAFVKNATSTDRANGAISAFTKALNKGKVEADGWETLVAAIPTIVNDIAAAAGKTTQQIRELGVSGGVTAQMLTEGLRGALDENRAAADGMATTLKDAFRNLSNNLSVYIGEANRSSGATSLLSSAIISLGENIDTIVKLLTAAGAGALAKYVAGLTASALASGKAAIQARLHAAEQLKLAIAEERAAAAAVAQAVANTRLGGSQAAAAAATARHTAAQTALAAAQASSAGAGSALLSVLGGPAGIIALVASAAAGFVLFGDNARNAVPDVNSLTEAIDKLGEAQLRLRRQQAEEAIDKLQVKAQEAGSVLRGMERDYAALSDRLGRGVDAKGLDNATKSITEQRAEIEQYEGQINTAREALSKINDEIDRRGKQGSAGVGAGAPKSDPDVQKRLQALRDERELADLTGEARARLQAVQKLGANATAAEQQEAARLAAEIYRLENAKKSATSATKAATKADAENVKVVDELANSLYEAGLSSEQLSVAKATAKLNPAATPAEIAQVEQLAKALWAATEAKQMLNSVDPIANEQNRFETELNNLKALNDAKILEDQRYLDLKAQAEKEHDETLFKLQEENFRRQSEWNEILMASLDYFQEASTNALLGLITGATDVTAAMQMLGQAILKEVVGSFIKMGIEQVKAWVMGQAAQRVAGLAYAASVAGQVGANTALAAQATFASISAIPIVGPAMAPAWAAQAAVTAGALGAPAITSAAASVGGGKLYGGAVAADTMYRINETGAPEILNLANGQQYLLPNQRGEVVSNRDATRQAAGPAGQARGYGQQPTVIALTLTGSWFSDKDIRRLVVDLNEALGDGAVLQVRG